MIQEFCTVLQKMIFNQWFRTFAFKRYDYLFFNALPVVFKAGFSHSELINVRFICDYLVSVLRSVIFSASLSLCIYLFIIIGHLTSYALSAVCMARQGQTVMVPLTVHSSPQTVFNDLSLLLSLLLLHSLLTWTTYLKWLFSVLFNRCS